MDKESCNDVCMYVHLWSAQCMWSFLWTHGPMCCVVQQRYLLSLADRPHRHLPLSFHTFWLSICQRKDTLCPKQCCVIAWTCSTTLWSSFVLSDKIGAPRFLSQIPYTSISCAQPEWIVKQWSIYFPIHKWHLTEKNFLSNICRKHLTTLV